MDDDTRSSLNIERIGCAVADSTSTPIAFASTSAASLSDTMS